MNDFEEKYAPSNFPYDDCPFFDEIKLAEEECPGVYYVSAVVAGDEIRLPKEYYVVAENSGVISDEAMSKGEIIDYEPHLYIFKLNDPESGHYIIEYEINRYRIKSKISLEPGKSLLASARYASEYHPDYFGEIASPSLTPWGTMTRYKRLMRGVFWMETDEAMECLAVFYAIWEGDLSEYTQSKAVFTEMDEKKGIQQSMGFAFYTIENGCLPVFELWHSTEKIHPHIDYNKLMNAMWTQHTSYTIAWNAREQQGLNDIIELISNDMGIEVPDRDKKPDSIKLTEGEGTDYIL